MQASSARSMAVYVLLIGTTMNLMSRGLGETFAVFLVPLEQAFETDRVAMTGIYSVYMLVYGLAAPGIGYLIDRFGTRLCYGLGLVLIAAGFGLASQASQLWQLYILIGAVCGVGTAALGMVPAATLASGWFDQRLPSAMSGLYAALGIGVLIFSPLSQWLIESSGWREAYFWLGLAPVLMMPMILLLPWRRLEAGSPQYQAQRDAKRSAQQAADTTQLAALSRRNELLAALRTAGFWKLAGVMFFTTLSTFTTLIQLVAFLVENGFEPLFAATVFGVVGLLSTIGMVCSGMFAERFGEKNVATFSYSCSIAGVGCLALLSVLPGLPLLILFVILFGSVSGSRGPLIAVLSSRLFNGQARATIYGCVLLAMGIGGAIAGWAGGMLHDLTNDYLAGFAVTALAALAGMLLFRSITVQPITPEPATAST